jgi:ribosome-interacting GTPase 1
MLAERKIVLTPVWPGNMAAGPPLPDDGDPFTIRIPTLLVVNKADQVDDPKAEMAVFEDLTDMHYPAIAVSAVTGEGFDRLGAFLFSSLEIIRVYTKTPGRPADMERPYTLRSSGTVHDIADMIHHDLAESLTFARLWREGSYDGAHVGADLELADGDILELHT